MRISRDGWASWPGPDGAEGLHVRVRRDDTGRLLITDLYLHGGEITAETLRAISLPQLAAALNAPQPESPEQLAAAHAGARSWAQGAPAAWSDDDLTVPKLRSRAPSERSTARRREQLSRPDGQDPDVFYRNVALAYSDHAATVRAPAKALAAEADVPVTTVHRWVREARRRGHLPPGRQGRTG